MSARAALKAVRDEKARVRARMTERVNKVSAAHESAVATETDTGPVYMMNQMDADEVEAWDRDNQEWSRPVRHRTGARILRRHAAGSDRCTEEWVPGDGPGEGQRRRFTESVMQVGQNKYQDDSGLTAFGGHPGELLLDQPLIARTGDPRSVPKGPTFARTRSIRSRPCTTTEG